MENPATGTQTAGREKTTSRLTSKQIKFIVGGIIIAITAGYLILSAAQGSAAYYMTVPEIKAMGPQARTVRVSGLIREDSIVWEPRDLHLQFEIVDRGGTLPVTYTGARPDMLKEGAELVVEGQLGADGIFQANTLILKCPSKYEEAP